MKILLAGSEQRCSSLREVEGQVAVHIIDGLDDSGLAMEVRRWRKQYDLVIIDGQTKDGEEGLVDLFDVVSALGSSERQSDCQQGMNVSCGVGVSKNGALELFCGLQKMAKAVKKGRVEPEELRQGGVIFEYHAPCAGKC